MNKKRRAAIREVICIIEEMQRELECIMEEEEDSMNNIPENLESSEMYETSERSIGHLDDALDGLVTAISALYNI